MSQPFRRTVTAALVLAGALLGPWPGSSRPQAAVFAPRPGPIERPLSIVAADFDRDGRDDLVVADYQAGTLMVLIARPDGTFEPIASGPFGVGSATFQFATSGPFQQLVVDLNPEDVDADRVANASDNCPNVYNPADVTTGKQLDTETAARPDAVCGNADDHPALYGPDLLCGTADDLVGDGVGEACERGEDTDADGEIDVAVDTDGDGVVDYDPATLILDNCPRLPNPGQEDADGDRIGDACAASPDLLILVASQASGSSFGALRIRLNDGEGGLVGRPSYLTGIGPGSFAVGNFTGDARLDVAVTNTTIDLVQLFPGLPDGEFGAQVFLTAGDGVQGSAAADIDGDGDTDLVVADRSADTLSIFRQAAGTLPTVASLTRPTMDAPTVLLAGRLDGDAFDDLVVLDQGANADDGRIEIFLGAADGVPVAGQVIALPAGQVPRAGLLRDLDGDGTLDLAVADFPGRQVLLFSGAGDGSFTASGPVPVPGQPTDLAAIDLQPGPPGAIDLAVLQFNNRVDLLVNGGGLAFTPAPTTPASPWRDTSAMALFGADTLVGADLVLLQRSIARLDVLSGIGDSTFRIAPVQTIEGLATGTPPDAAAMLITDLRLDNRPDLAVLDPTAGRLTILTNELTGRLVERVTESIDPGAAGLASGTLIGTTTDLDRDGVPNDRDNCPAVYNPPGCRVTDAACPMEVPCADPVTPPPACDPADPLTLDPATGQCDGDRNGIGDHCQVLSATCARQDSDFDLTPDYNPDALARAGGFLDFDRDGIPNHDTGTGIFDNCPTVANSDQADANLNGVGDACETLSGGLPVDPDLDGVPTFDPATLVVDNCPDRPNPAQQDNDGDRVGNACVIAAAIDNCPATINLDQKDTNGDGAGDACSFPPNDILVANPVTGEVLLLGGDSTGALHPAAASPLAAPPGPVAAATGHFALNCSLPTICFGRTDFDIAVAARGVAGDPSDDRVGVYRGDGFGGFSALAPAVVSGDPAALILAPNQPVCSLANDPARPNLRFDPDHRSDVLALVQPGSPGIQILLVSNQNVLDPLQSPLVPPVAQPAPLPAPAPLVAAVSIDANRDGVIDLVSLSAPPGGPSTLTLFIGIGNGLFFTDPTINPAPLAAELRLPVAGFIDIKADSVYPDLAFFNVTDQAPITLFNVLRERADIDRSGRVDGRDLALLAVAFGAARGEDFNFLPDATFEQTGSGPTRRLVGSGSASPGQNLPDSAGFCSAGFEPGSGLYGLPVDINLDGIVDGEDLAFLASLFGAAVTP